MRYFKKLRIIFHYIHFLNLKYKKFFNIQTLFIFSSVFGIFLFFGIHKITQADSTAYYVAKTGNDSYTPTQAQNPDTPWLTLQHAEDTVSNGDTVYVSAGTYVENNASTHGWNVSKAITWISTGEVIVRSQPGDYRPLYVTGTETASYTGFTFDGEETKTQVVYLLAGSANKTFVDCTFRGSTNWLFYANTSNLTVRDSTFESTNSAVTVLKGGTFTNALFDGNTFNITANSLINSLINTVTFSSNVINATLSGTLFGTTMSSGDYSVTGNTISLGGTPISLQTTGVNNAGSMLWNSNDITVSSTTSGELFNLFRGTTDINITNNAITMESSLQAQEIIFLDKQTSPVITGNTIETFASGALSHIAVTSSDGSGGGIAEIKNNILKSRSTDGHIIAVGYESSTAGDNTYDGVVIESNSIYGPLYYDPDLAGVSIHAIYVGYNKNASIKFNNVIGGGYGVVVKAGGMAYTDGGIFYNKFINSTGIASIHVKGVQDINIFNNSVFAQSSFSGSYYLVWINQNGVGELATGASLKNNILYGGGSSKLIYVNTNSISGFASDNNLLYRHNPGNYGYDGTTNYSFSEWQGLGYDVHSVNSDPLFLDSDNFDFRCNRTSPVINAGIDVGQTLDFVGSSVPQGARPDIGAFEYIPLIVTINQSVDQDDPTNETSIHFTVVFSEVVSDFVAHDISISGTAEATTASILGSGTTYTVTISGMTKTGTVLASIAADRVHGTTSNTNEASTSTDNVVTYDITLPIISSVSSTSTFSGATITWTTDESSSSQVEYGQTILYGYITSEMDTSSGVTSHSVSIIGLLPCTTYHYRVRSMDAAGNETVGSDQTFVTSGCTGSYTEKSCTDEAPGSAPKKFKATVQDANSILISFYPADGPVKKYILRYGTESGKYPYKVNDLGVRSEGEMSYLVDSLESDTMYYFKIRGVNGCAKGAWTKEVKARTEVEEEKEETEVENLPTTGEKLAKKTTSLFPLIYGVIGISGIAIFLIRRIYINKKKKSQLS